MSKCNCYHEEYNKPVCWGTREKEECSCGGYETKCNFYPEKRAAATVNQNKMKLYAARDKNTGKLVSGLINPSHKFWHRRGDCYEI